MFYFWLCYSVVLSGVLFSWISLIIIGPRLLFSLRSKRKSAHRSKKTSLCPTHHSCISHSLGYLSNTDSARASTRSCKMANRMHMRANRINDTNHEISRTEHPSECELSLRSESMINPTPPLLATKNMNHDIQFTFYPITAIIKDE